MSKYYNGRAIISYLNSEGLYYDLPECYNCEYLHAEAYGMVSCKRKYCKYSAEEIARLIDKHKEETHGLD